MTVTIDGTTGISSVDGSSSSPSVRGADANSGIVYAADTVAISTGGSERMRVDSSGRVGVNNTSPGSSWENADDLVIGDGSGHRGMTILAGTGSISGIEFSDGTGSDAAKTTGGIRYDHSGNYMRFQTNDGNERLRIDSSGHVLFNCTSLPSTSVAGAGFEKNGDQAILFSSSGSSSGSSNHAEFKNGNGTVGTINTNGSATSYNTSSDYRLKENATAISDGLTRLKTLKPYRFNFKADATKTVDGFFAHEITAVPEAITGTKDEVDSDNNPVYQGIDQSKLVPLLTAALQEAITKIETLETKVAALEAA
tara:strand:+ start:399 stop:1328 length:930 start_codon:yes stop_codon:yes gene_type:complete